MALKFFSFSVCVCVCVIAKVMLFNTAFRVCDAFIQNQLLNKELRNSMCRCQFYSYKVIFKKIGKKA